MSLTDKEKYFAGIDLGTSGCRLNILNNSKQLILNKTISFTELERVNPAAWWDSVRYLLGELPREIKAHLSSLAIDGTSGSILLVDKRGNPSSSVLMYDDLRATAEAAIIRNSLPENSGGQGASSSLARLLWLLRHESNSHHAHAVHQADFIMGRLLENYTYSDENNCLKLGYDVFQRRWPLPLSAKLGINPSLLPKVYPAGRYISTINTQTAKQLDLPDSLQIVSGTTDSVAAFIASGANQIGDAVTSLGSTLVTKVLSESPVFAPKQGIYSHRLGDYWLVGGASNTGGKVLKHFFTQHQIEALTKRLKPNQPTGLDYYPLIVPGERFPVADAQKQPKLTPRPQDDRLFFQGVLEGMARIEAQGYQALQQLGAPTIQSVRTAGGGSVNIAWTQIRAQLLQVPMIPAEQTDAAYGTALLALRGYVSTKNDA